MKGHPSVHAVTEADAAGRDRLRELSLLAELSRITSGTLEQDVLLGACLEAISEELGFGLAMGFVSTPSGIRAASLRELPSSGLTAASQPALQRLAEAAVASGEVVSQLTRIGSAPVYSCAVPLPARVGVDGALGFAKAGDPISGSELEMLSTATSQLGFSLENAKLFSEATRRADELKMLLDVGRAITSLLDLEQILDVSAEILVQMVNASNSFILLVSEENQELKGVGCSNPAWRLTFRDVRIPLSGKTLAAKAIRARKPVVIEDVSLSEHASGTRTRLFGEKSLLALPLLVRDEPIGCIVVDDVRRPRAWSADEVERATLIAHQIAVAIANARLYDHLRRSYAQLGRAQEELVKRERLAALGEMAAVVAHEVRNPLGVIFNSLGSLDKLLHPEGDAKMLLEIVGEEAERLDRIVRDLLEFARPHEPTLKPQPLGPLIEETLYTARGHAEFSEQTEVTLLLEHGEAELALDERMMRQALLNLFLNALQAMPKGGKMTVRTSAELVDGEQRVRVEVIDQGGGVAPEFVDRIFQPFFTTRATGTGLGLSVVKRVIEAHGGRVLFESVPGAGSTFSFSLPMEEPHP